MIINLWARLPVRVDIQTQTEMRNTMQDLSETELRLLVMQELGLSRDDAGQYIMERRYNRMNHSQAMAELKQQGRIK